MIASIPQRIRTRLTGALLAAGLALAAPHVRAEILRVTTWDLHSGTATNLDKEAQVAAEALKKLSPDVILLHGVRDWQTCAQLAQKLKPANYNVLACSSFRPPDKNSPGVPQVAILAQRKSYMTWSQPWHNGDSGPLSGGYAFASIAIANHRIGFFVLQTGSQPARSDDAASDASPIIKQWLPSISSVRNWVANRVEAIVASAELDVKHAGRESLKELEEAGFSNPFLMAGQPESSAGPVVTALTLNTNASPGLLLDHSPATCDLDLDAARGSGNNGWARGRLLPPEPVVASRPAEPVSLGPVLDELQNSGPEGVKVANAPTAATLQTAAAQVPERNQAGMSSTSPYWWVGAGVVGAFALLGLTRLLPRKQLALSASRTALLPLQVGNGSQGLPAYTVIVTPTAVLGPGSSAQMESVPSRLPVISMTSASVVRAEGASRVPDGESETWKQRALAAEQQAQHNAELMRRGLLPHLGQWLKQGLVRRLISDRAQLLETQQAATLKTLEVDRRLTRVEEQLQEQTRAYTLRIEALTRELHAAKEESRALIRAQINQVKLEMEAARARLLSGAA